MNKIIQIGLYDPGIPLLCVHHREPLLNYILDFILFVGDCTEGFLKQNIGRLKFPSSDDFGFVFYHSLFCVEKNSPTPVPACCAIISRIRFVDNIFNFQLGLNS